MTDLERLTTATDEPALEPPASELTTSAQGLATKPLTPGRLAWRRFRRHKLALLSAAVLLVIMVMVTFPGLFTHYTPNQQLRARGDTGPLLAHLHPQSGHWFGTDRLGRDQWTRVLYGGRISIAVGIGVAIVSTLVGAVLGALAGYYGGWLENVVMRVTDLFLAMPLLVILIIAGQLPARQAWARTLMGDAASIRAVITIIALFFWMPVRADSARSRALAQGKGVRRGCARGGRIRTRGSSPATFFRTVRARSSSMRRWPSRPRS